MRYAILPLLLLVGCSSAPMRSNCAAAVQWNIVREKYMDGGSWYYVLDNNFVVRESYDSGKPTYAVGASYPTAKEVCL